MSHSRPHVFGPFHIERDEREGWCVLHTATGKLVDHSYARHAAMITAQQWAATHDEAAVLRRVFVYGMLLDRVPEYVPGAMLLYRSAALHGYRLWESARLRVPYVVADEPCVTVGQVWRLPAEPLAGTLGLWALDRAEHVDRGSFRRTALPLADADPAWVYTYLHQPAPGDTALGLRYVNKPASVG